MTKLQFLLLDSAPAPAKRLSLRTGAGAILRAMIAVIVCCGLLGCVSTLIRIPIKLPDGEIVMAEYHSNRDVEIAGLHLEMRADGTFIATLEGASGQASPVIQAYGYAMSQGYELGKAATLEAAELARKAAGVP